MKNKKPALLLVLIILVSGAGYFFYTQQQDVTRVPTLSSRVGDASPSAEFLNAQRAVDYYREEIRRKPHVVKKYVELAQLFLQESRVTGNHKEYLPKAERLIAEALNRDPENADALITRASMLMTMHQFDEARKLAEGVVEKQPYTAMAYGVLCDALVELGQYDQAVNACDKMLSIRPDLRSYSRASFLRELHGDLDGAIEAMKMAADAGVTGQENRAWALYNLGKLFLNQGKLDTAAYIFKGILEERQEYAFAMSGLAQVNRAKGNIQEAVDLLSKAFEVMPEHVFVEQLADVYRSCGQRENADGIARVALQTLEQHEKDGWNINGEYAMFCANHDMNLGEALQRAEKEFDSRPNNLDVLETYAWALFKNGRPGEAIPLIEKAMQMNAHSYSLLHHASMIYAATGMKDKAEALRDRAKKENPFVNVFLTEGNLVQPSAPTPVASLQ